MRNGKRATQYLPHDAAILHTMSKAAVLDLAASLAACGTDESAAEITAKLCSDAVIILEGRGDRVHPKIRALARAAGSERAL